MPLSLATYAAALATALALGSLSDEFGVEHVMNIGSKGMGEGQFRYVEDIAFAKDGKLLVTDAGPAWVQVFDPISGEFLARFGGRGEADHSLEKPQGVAVDILFEFGGEGIALGKFKDPEAAKIGPDGNVYVTDLMNDRVQILSPEGTPLRHIGGSGSGSGRGELKSPAGLHVDTEGRIFVTEIGNSRVQVFDQDGNSIAMWGRHGSGDGEFKKTHGIIVSPQSQLVYVAGTGNNRVQVFRAPWSPGQ